MIQQHWDFQNTFEHYGPGDFGMLGWNALRNPENLALFQFGELDKKNMIEGLLESLPRNLHGLVSEKPVTIDAVHHIFANQTAARFSDMDQALITLVEEGEFQILDSEYKVRRQSVQRLAPTDRVTLSREPLLTGLSRGKT